MARQAVLVVNLGSPDAPTVPAVRRYLREFLLDPRVIDIPGPLRFMLVQGIIAPFRSPKSAHAYQQVWTASGSPLVASGKDLVRKVQERLGSAYKVHLAMRYGQPALAKVLTTILDEQPDELTVIPLFPQYASATTGSVIEEMTRVLQQRYNVPSFRVISDFYEDPAFIDAFACVARPQLEAFQPDHVLFSYHGLPERQIRKSDPSKTHCLVSKDCCATIDAGNRYCYRAQCFGTTRALVAALHLAPDSYSTAFQSRLGRDPWIQPYTEERLQQLRDQGVKRLAVMCPAFVADCLETLEEIGMRAAEDWQKMGGEAFKMVSSLNSEDPWCEAIASWVRGGRSLSGGPSRVSPQQGGAESAPV